MSRLLASLIILLSLSRPTLADTGNAIAQPDCNAGLEHRSSEPHALIVRSPCPMSLRDLSALLDQHFQAIASNQPSAIQGIYLGRVMDYPEWSKMLAVAAAKSPGWNAKRGRPGKAGESDNQRIALLLNGPAYPQTLKPLFAKYQLTGCIGDVEKVLVFKAKEIWPGNKAIPQGISPEARLPVDAQVWLTLQPLSSACDLN